MQTQALLLIIININIAINIAFDYLVSETVPVEYLGGKPLCMHQYYQILSSCRIPGLKQDTVVNHAQSSRPPTHITVVHNFQVQNTS